MDTPIVLVVPPETILVHSPAKNSCKRLGGELTDSQYFMPQSITKLDIRETADVTSMPYLADSVLETTSEEEESLFNVRNNHVRGILEPEVPEFRAEKFDLSFVSSTLQLFGQLPDSESDFPRNPPDVCCLEFLECLRRLHGDAEDGIPKPNPSRLIRLLLSSHSNIYTSLQLRSNDRLANAEFSPPLAFIRLLLNIVMAKSRFRSRFKSMLITKSSCPRHETIDMVHETRYFVLPPELAVGEVPVLKHLHKIVTNISHTCCSESTTHVEFLSLPRFLVIFLPRNQNFTTLKSNPFSLDVTFKIPQEIDMNSFVPNAKESLYRLHGFITQTATNGVSPRMVSLPRATAATGPLHYICYTKCQDDVNFVRCDEELVTQVELGIGEIRTSGVQVVVYSLQDQRLGGAAKFVETKPKKVYSEAKVVGRGVNNYWS
jgi:hypothetical protein